MKVKENPPVQTLEERSKNGKQQQITRNNKDIYKE
jgi:hypothetical protein